MSAALIAPVSVLVFAAVLAAPAVWLAGRRGRSRVLWGALGIAFPFLSILLLAVLGQNRNATAH